MLSTLVYLLFLTIWCWHLHWFHSVQYTISYWSVLLCVKHEWRYYGVINRRVDKLSLLCWHQLYCRKLLGFHSLNQIVLVCMFLVLMWEWRNPLAIENQLCNVCNSLELQGGELNSHTTCLYSIVENNSWSCLSYVRVNSTITVILVCWYCI